MTLEPTRAALLVYEGFDYTDGTTLDENTTDLNGGSGLSGTWATTDTAAGDANFTVDSGGTTAWGDLNQEGAALKRQNTSGVEAINRTITADLSTGVTDLWFSVLLSTRGTAQFAIGTQGFADGSSGNGGMGAGDGFGISASGNTVGTIGASTWSNGSKVTAGGGDFGVGVQLFVGHVEYGTGGANDTYNLYAVGTDLTLGTAIATRSVDVDESALDTLTLSTNRDTVLDEIRIGTSYEDVVPSVIPEPSSVALLGIGGLTIVLLRGRR